MKTNPIFNRQRIVTFCRDNGGIEAMTEAEYKANGGLPDDWADFVWQNAYSKQTAIEAHDLCLDAWNDDVNNGREPQDAYSL